MNTFDKSELKKLYKPSQNRENGQVTIIGGSRLFHGAPLLSLKVASRIVDMVFFTSPESSVGRVANLFKSKIFSFIWVPWEEVDAYIEKSDAVLIGPGFMRYARETQYAKRDTRTETRIAYHISRISQYDEAGTATRNITKRLVTKFAKKRWVIDAGSLQVIDPELLPKGCIVTPNNKEFEMLFKVKCQRSNVKSMAEKYNCIINSKGPVNIVCSPKECVEIPGGNAGLTKGGVGDVLAGLTVALLAKNEPFLAATAASFICKMASDELFKKVGPNYNADDLADKIPETFHKLLK